jgi:ferredoxin
MIEHGHATLHIHVDERKCEGHGLCVQLAPDIFDLPDDEIAFCPMPPGSEHREVDNAAAAAGPRQAITVTDSQDPR